MSPSRLASAAVILAISITSGCAPAVPARAYLHTDQEPSSEATAYAYLIWPARVSDAGVPRALAVCESYLRNLEPLSRVRVPASEVIITYWLLATNAGSRVREQCGQLIETYDYPRAAVVAAEIERPGAAGPLLVAYGRGSPAERKGQALIFDLSDFPSEDIDRAFGIWKDRVSREPALWNDGFRLVVLREALRNFLNTYGEDILRVAPR